MRTSSTAQRHMVSVMMQRSTGAKAVLRPIIAAAVCLLLASVTYGIRGYDYVNDDKNGGVHDVLTLVVIYSALVGVVVLCCAALVRAVRTILR